MAKQNTPSKSAFDPRFTIAPDVAKALMRIEAAKHAIASLPITPRVLANLRETARLFSTHYSTQIEGNRLTQVQVTKVIRNDQHFPGRERDEFEVKGYYVALDEVERLIKQGRAITEGHSQKLHALVMAGGRTRVKATPYRDGQNVIRDGRTKAIVYLPPEAKDVPTLMRQLFAWLNEDNDWPAPIKSAIAHYQYATIHPYYDGNGRSARLLTTLVLHLGGYDLKGLYALEEYYARDLGAYYKALTLGPSHNYYLGRSETDITPWVRYFIAGMAQSFEKVREQVTAESARGGTDRSRVLRELDAQQQKAVTLFERTQEITAKDVARLFGYKPRTSTWLCRRWVEMGFLEIASASRKTRRYRLGKKFAAEISSG